MCVWRLGYFINSEWDLATIAKAYMVDYFPLYNNMADLILNKLVYQHGEVWNHAGVDY